MAFGVVAVLSLVVLFAPSGDGAAPFPQSDKVVHATLFLLLAWSARRCFGAGLPVLLAVAAYAPLSELVQAGLLPGRSGDARDVVADLAGVALGWSWAGRRQQAREDEPDRVAGERTGP